MKEHIDRFKSNHEFLCGIEKNWPKDYNDWKITIIFYCALHLIKAYCKLNKKNIGFSHTQILENIDPSNTKALLPISVEAFNAYHDLYLLSKNSRYLGLYNDGTQLVLLDYNLKQAKTDIEIIKVFLTKEGLKFK